MAEEYILPGILLALPVSSTTYGTHIINCSMQLPVLLSVIDMDGSDNSMLGGERGSHKMIDCTVQPVQ